METAAAKHLMAYNLISEPTGYMESFPVVNWTVSRLQALIGQIMVLLAAIKPIASIWNRFDALLLALMVRFDNTFPLVANFSFVGTYNAIIAQVNKAISSLQAWGAQLGSYVSVVVKAVNDYYQHMIDLVLPYETALEQEFTNEYQRGVALLVETYRRIAGVATRVSSLPTHVSNVYSTESKDTKSTTQAVTKTTQKLSMEAYDHIKPSLDKFVGLKDKPIDSIAVHSTGVEVL